MKMFSQTQSLVTQKYRKIRQVTVQGQMTVWRVNTHKVYTDMEWYGHTEVITAIQILLPTGQCMENVK